MTSEYLFRHSDNELLHWIVALDGKPLASGEVPLDVAPQGKQLIELPGLPQSESAGQLAHSTRSATERDRMVRSRTHQRLAAVASGGKPQRDTPRAPRHPATDHQRNGFLHRSWIISVGNLTASQAFFHRCGLAMKNNC